MTLEQLRAREKEMAGTERWARYQECLNTGGWDQFLQPVRDDEYCGNCLTLYVSGIPQDPPRKPQAG